MKLVRPSKWLIAKSNEIHRLLKIADEIRDKLYDYTMGLAYGIEIYEILRIELVNIYIDICEVLGCVPLSMRWKIEEETEEERMKREDKEDEEAIERIIEEMSKGGKK